VTDILFRSLLYLSLHLAVGFGYCSNLYMIVRAFVTPRLKSPPASFISSSWPLLHLPRLNHFSWPFFVLLARRLFLGTARTSSFTGNSGTPVPLWVVNYARLCRQYLCASAWSGGSSNCDLANIQYLTYCEVDSKKRYCYNLFCFALNLQVGVWYPCKERQRQELGIRRSLGVSHCCRWEHTEGHLLQPRLHRHPSHDTM
jgi:hypothetical protein